MKTLIDKLGYVSVTAAFLTVVCFPSCSALTEHRKASKSLERLEEMNIELKQRIEAIEEEIHHAQNTKALEHIARDELGWARPGEITLVLND